jgi:hypothetical protein
MNHQKRMRMTGREYIGRTGRDHDSIEDCMIFARIFLHLFCEDTVVMKDRMNNDIAAKKMQIGSPWGRSNCSPQVSLLLVWLR